MQLFTGCLRASSAHSSYSSRPDQPSPGLKTSIHIIHFMAATDILQSPCQYNTMPSKQRAPLSNIPNALNSPARITSSKRSRPDGKSLLDDVPAPAAKRQHLDRDFALRQERENIPQPPQTPQKKKPVPSLTHLGHGGRSDAVDRERVQRQQALIAKEKEKCKEEIGIYNNKPKYIFIKDIP